MTPRRAELAVLLARWRPAAPPVPPVPPVPARRGRGTARSAGPTERELEVLQLVERGLSNDAIAAKLVVAERTVRSHLENLRAKLKRPPGERSRTALVHRARMAGWLPPAKPAKHS